MAAENNGMEVRRNKERRKKKNKYRVLLTVLASVLGVIVIALGALFLVIRHYYKMSNYQKDPDEITVDSSLLESMREADTDETMESALEESIQNDIASEIAAARSSLLASLGVSDPALDLSTLDPSETLPSGDDMAGEGGNDGNGNGDGQQGENQGDPQGGQQGGDANPSQGGQQPAGPTAKPTTAAPPVPVVPQMIGNTHNVLLIGVDRRDASWAGNSDAMILISINYDKHKITMTSFMRDTYAYIPGAGYWKMNRSCALGGAPLTCATLEATFLLHVDNYATCDFNGLRGLINAIGGIDVSLTPSEAAYIGISIPGEQVVHLNGNQALAHARDRSSSGFDYARTARQRKVLMAIYNKIKSGSLGGVASAASAILPYVVHNIDGGTLANLIANAPSLMNWPIQQLRVPFDGQFYSQNEYLIPYSYQDTINQLYAYIY